MANLTGTVFVVDDEGHTQPVLKVESNNPVSGPSSATDGNLAVFSGPTGNQLKDGGPPGGGGSGSRRVIYASTIAALNSNVETGGGTDDTTALQTALTGGNVTLVMDGAALISNKLLIESNTTIYCLNQSCGFFLAGGTNEPLIENRNYNITNTVTDENLAFIGGIYNGNVANQAAGYPGPPVVASSGRYVTGIELGAVRNVLIRDVEMRDIIQMNVHFSAVETLRVYNLRCNMENTSYQGMNYGFNSGLHINGPFSDIAVENLWARLSDDIIALNADDDQGLYTMWSHGDGSDVLINGVTLVGCRSGIRLLTSVSSLDRVTIRNVKGDSYSCGIQINHWTNNDGPGNFGTITLDNFDVRVSGAGYTGPGIYNPDSWCYINVAAVVSVLRITNFSQSDFFDARPAILLDTDAIVNTCSIDSPYFNSYATNPIRVNGTLTTMVIVPLSLFTATQVTGTTDMILGSSLYIVGYDGVKVATNDENDFEARVIANGGTISGSTLTAVNNFVGAAKSNAYWDKIQRINLFCGDNLAAALVPLKITSNAGTLTETNSGFTSGAYSEATGFTGDGANSLGTGYYINGITPNSLSFGVYSRSTAAIAAPDLEASYPIDLSNIFGLYTRYTGDIAYFNNGSATGSISGASTDGSGFFVSSRTASNIHKAFRNGTQFGTTNTGAQGTLLFESFNVLGDAGVFSTRVLGAYFIGLGLSDTDVANFYTDMQAFQAALGRSV